MLAQVAVFAVVLLDISATQGKVSVFRIAELGTRTRMAAMAEAVVNALTDLHDAK